MRSVRQLGSDVGGATSVEYGLILALIFLAMVGAVSAFARGSTDMWNNVTEEIEDARP